ncbi:1-phosphofructokinase family hexose kinase [Aeromicrobium phragmitis]|uniref:1-phosphofructokinase family hexose kinase n=1 Tax=Aeromicrobium phragmitis TaxID=2478914 RepID=A0A3L8PIN3_9ACTN|nr:1-phosphofructokinase family hexose kinase [Aeromicrobium phragmitis]RLV55187.1 1-phosphofructokinase family hexose kinase [Aeromicrobium phragmitis]
MIVTLTPNPSIDRTVQLSSPLERGGVVRSVTTRDEAGGKGINVAQVVRNGGEQALAVLPGDDDDPLVQRLRNSGLPHLAVPLGAPLRVNLTLAEDDGTTTKINAPGPALAAPVIERLEALLAEQSATASWAALCGSLPPGVPDDWYGRTAERLEAPVALDTSGAALSAAVDRAPERIALIKPNSDELGELMSIAPTEFEGDPKVAGERARPLLERGIGAILLTLGARGALLISTEAVWEAQAPRITARSTVGAGDSSLAGFLLGSLRGEDPAGCLALAVAYGSAAASLPGSRMPAPADLPALPSVRRVA